MESVYPPRRFTCTAKLTDLNEYFNEFSKECFNNEYKEEDSLENTLFELYGDGFDMNKLEGISEICSINNLTVPDEFTPIDEASYTNYVLQKNIPDTAKSLQVVQAKVEWGYKCKARPRDLENINLMHDFSKTIDFIIGSDIVITVRMYQPFASFTNEAPRWDHRKSFFKCSHEINALGSQSLKELRDKILCSNDAGSSVEVEDIFQDTCESVYDNYTSSLICLDNKLYVDMPEKNSIDYSTVIKKWAKEKEFKEAFITEDMKNAKLNKLNFRLGYPYVYQHRGDCEHILVFSDIRLLKKTDPLSKDDYPYHVSVNRLRGNVQHCGLCQKLAAQWQCVNSDRLVHDSTFLCHECNVSYNYVNGKKIGKFKLYHYNNKTLIDQ